MPDGIQPEDSHQSARAAKRALAELLQAPTHDMEAISAAVQALHADVAPRVLSLLNADQREQLVEALPPDEAAELLEEINETQAAEIVADMPPEAAAAVFEELPPGKRSNLIDELTDAEADAVLAEMPDARAEQERERMAYEEGTAGALMTSDHLSYPLGMSISGVIEDLRENADDYADFAIQYAYVTDGDGSLRGVLRLRDIVLAPRGMTTADAMIADPVAIIDSTPLEKSIALFKEKPFLGVPVTDDEGRLLGVLSKRRVDEAESRLAKRTFLRASGIVGGEELRSMPLHLRSVRRLSWLVPNIILNLVAASVIAAHQATLEAVIALAVFLPIVSDMSGCSGNQAVAVSIRELSMGLLRPRDAWRVFLKEAGIGLINGCVLGLVLGSVAGIWQGNIYLGMVVGAALAMNTMLSVVLGGLVPLLLRKFKVDPALASGPLLTTATDMCGFFLVLSFAGLVLEKLV